MSVSCYFPASFSWLLFLGYPLAMLGGTINSFGIFAFMWLLPEHQNFTASMSSGAQALSDMLALVAVGLSACCQVFVGEFFLFLSVLSFLAGLAGYWLIPSQELVNALASAALGDSGAALQDDQGAGPGQGWEGEMKTVQSCWRLMKQHAGANVLLLLFSTMYIMAIMYPMQQMLFYYTALFPDKETPELLVNSFAFIYGIGGFVCALGGGRLCDALGIQKFTLAVTGEKRVHRVRPAWLYAI
jgi:hypothetical protein